MDQPTLALSCYWLHSDRAFDRWCASRDGDVPTSDKDYEEIHEMAMAEMERCEGHE